jgi:hypothetical protein
MCTTTAPSRSSSTPSTFTAGKPTNSSHRRVASDSTGVLRIDWLQNLPILGAPMPRRVDPYETLTPRSDPKRPSSGGRAPSNVGGRGTS